MNASILPNQHKGLKIELIQEYGAFQKRPFYELRFAFGQEKNIEAFSVTSHIAKRTRHLSNIEDLAYRRLLDLYYSKECPMPNNLNQLARLIDLRENVEEIKEVLNDFFKLENNFWINKRADEEIAIFRSKADTARSNGKKGGRPKKPNPNPEETQKKPKITQPVNLANPEETGLKANQEPITKNHKPTTNIKDKVKSSKPDQATEIFLYWRDVMKKPSAKPTAKRIKAVKDRLKDGYTVDELKSAIYGCSITPHNNGTDPKGNGQRYDDLELICRRGEFVERFIENGKRFKSIESDSARNKRIGLEWANEGNNE